MYKRLLASLQRQDRKKLTGRVFAVLVTIVLLVVLVVHLTQPTRSVAAYCKVYKQEAIKLGNNGGSVYLYSTSVFPNASSNSAGYFIPTFDKLDAVAPTEIEPQIKAMRDIFAKMQSDPGQTVSLAFNGLPSEQAVTAWTQQHCGTPLN